MAQIRALDLPPHAVRFPYVSTIQVHLPKSRHFPIFLIQRTISVEDVGACSWCFSLDGIVWQMPFLEWRRWCAQGEL